MSNNQQNDQGYKSVIKEYDLYNNDINDFEIIDEIPTNYINDKKGNNNDKNDEIKKTKDNDKLQNFVNEILKIIFYSRNKLSEFSSNITAVYNLTKILSILFVRRYNERSVNNHRFQKTIKKRLHSCIFTRT